MNSQNGIVLWILGFAGFLFIYAAVKDESPLAIVAHYTTGAKGAVQKLAARASNFTTAAVAPTAISTANLGTPHAPAPPATQNA